MKNIDEILFIEQLIKNEKMYYIIQEYKAGKSSYAIAKKYGTSIGVVERLIISYDIPLRKRVYNQKV